MWAWGADFDVAVAAIEVYPAATLRAWGLPSGGYKRQDQLAVREAILQGLQAQMATGAHQDAILSNADSLDAVICVQAGQVFLEGRAHPPGDLTEAQAEGWIWVADSRCSDPN